MPKPPAYNSIAAALMGRPPPTPGLSPPAPPLNAMRPQPKMVMRPFQPGERISNADGSYSTERTVTIQAPDGGWVNVPTLWMGANGPVDLGATPDAENAVQMMMKLYERSGPQFTRYRSVDEAVSAAQQRSNAGGAASGRRR